MSAKSKTADVGTAVFGWCLTKQHDRCKVVIDHWGQNRRCGCQCHEIEEKP